MRTALLKSLVFVSLLQSACDEGKALEPASTDAAPPPPAPPVEGASVLVPRPAPDEALHPYEGEQLPDVSPVGLGGEAPGWDLCGKAGIALGPRASRNDPNGPQASYLVFGDRTAQPAAQTPTAQDLLHVYFYFSSEQSLEHRGLWFEVRRLAAPSQSITLSLFATDPVCQPQKSLGRFHLNRLLEVDEWVTACAPFPESAKASYIGLRIDGADAGDAALGLSGLRFGHRCPVQE